MQTSSPTSLNRLSGSTRFKAISPFPAMERDLALVVDENVSAKRLEDLIFSTDNGMIEHLSIFDVFRGSKLPDGKKSLAFTIRYAHPERTLTSAEVEEMEKKILGRLSKEVGAELRK